MEECVERIYAAGETSRVEVHQSVIGLLLHYEGRVCGPKGGLWKLSTVVSDTQRGFPLRAMVPMSPVAACIADSSKGSRTLHMQRVRSEPLGPDEPRRICDRDWPRSAAP